MTALNFSVNWKGTLDTAKLRLSVFSGAFMLPISTLAITSLFLVIGAFLESKSAYSLIFGIYGTAIKSICYPILTALPILFCVSFAMTYSKNDTTAIWCALIAYLTFIYFQSAFIFEKPSTSTSTSSSIKFKETIVLFYRDGWTTQWMKNLTHTVFGARSLNTSVIGSILIGGYVVPKVIKKFSNYQLPEYISFFSGKRFLPFASAISGACVSFLFLIFWPYFGSIINWFGHQILKTPYGIDSFLFGFLERLLVPFGLHHAFYSPFWYTSLGGDVIAQLAEKNATISNGTVGTSSSYPKERIDALEYFKNIIENGGSTFTAWQGDSFMGLSTIGLPSNSINGKPVFDFYKNDLGMHVGRFTSGKFPIMQFGLPAAGLAMIYAAPKENRKAASAQIIPGILTSAIMGITEPLEFLFLFKAPKLFFCFHTVMCGFSFMLMNIFGTHVPSVFSGGFIEFFLMGIIPQGKGTHFYMWMIVGLLLVPIYFSTFFLSIKMGDIETPGREKSKKETINESNVSDSSHNSEVPEKTRNLAIGFGGWDNVENYGNCASRLRYNIIDKNKVNEEYLKKGGVISVKWIGDKHVQAIVGPKAETINNDMLKWKDKDLAHTFSFDEDKKLDIDIEVKTETN